MTPEELLKKHDLKGPYSNKAAEAKLYYLDFVNPLFKRWGDFIAQKFPGRDQYITYCNFITDQWLEVYYLQSELEKVIIDYVDLVKKRPDFLQSNYQDWKESCLKLDQAFEEGDYFKICEAYLEEYFLSCAVPEAFSLAPEATIIPAIREYTDKYNLDFQETFALLTSPIVDSFINQEEKELLATDNLEAHQQKWHWIQNNYCVIKELDVEFFKNKKKNLNPKPDSDIIKQKQKLFSKYPPSEDLKLYVQLSEIFSEMQDVRKGYVLKANSVHKKYLTQLSKEKNITLEDLEYYTYPEIKNFKEVNPQEIAERKKILFNFTSKEEKLMLTGEDAQEIKKYFKQSSDDKEIRGLVANKGRAQGRVKIILTSKDISKVEPGDILVSTMTRPEMVPAMKQAAAIVTDEGGITSHAAIVSRELGIPCILATKHATKILKDGDQVEVNADQGTVKKL